MQMTLTKADLSEQLYEKVGLNNRESKEMVEAFFQCRRAFKSTQRYALNFTQGL